MLEHLFFTTKGTSIWDTLISALYLYLTAQTHCRLLGQAEEGLGAAEARGKEGRNDSLRSTREVKTNKAIKPFQQENVTAGVHALTRTRYSYTVNFFWADQTGRKITHCGSPQILYK